MAAEPRSTHTRAEPLRVLDEALTLSVRTRELLGRGARQRERGLCEQICRACDSVRLNIAEGRARPTRRDTQKFLGTAWASLCEFEAQLPIARASGIYSESAIAELAQRARWIARLLAGLRRHYERASR